MLHIPLLRSLRNVSKSMLALRTIPEGRSLAAACIAWSLPLPALYILNSLAGSRLRPSTTFLSSESPPER